MSNKFDPLNNMESVKQCAFNFSNKKDQMCALYVQIIKYTFKESFVEFLKQYT